jgi:hypothetical protein
MRSPVAPVAEALAAVAEAAALAAVLVAVWVQPAWAVLPSAAERHRDWSAAARLQERWEVERRAPAVQPAMERRERAIPL